MECVCVQGRVQRKEAFYPARKSVEFGERGVYTVEPGLDLMGTTRTKRATRKKDD